MYPSSFRTSSTQRRILEAGVRTVGLPRIEALRMRASMSPSGSFIDILPSLPARLDHAGDLPLRSEIPERDPRHPQLPVIGAWTARHLAPVVEPGRRRVARKLGQLQPRLEPLLHGELLVRGDLLQLGALRGVFLDEGLTLLLPLDHAAFCHL